MSTYMPPLPVVMSRENSAEDVTLAASSSLHPGGRSTGDAADLVAQLSRSLEAGPSRLAVPGASEGTGHPTGRRASKSVSGTRPNISITPAKRTQSYYTPQVKAVSAFPSSPVPSSPEVGPNVVKRRTSTPSLVRRYTMREDEPLEENQLTERDMELLNESASKKGKGKASDSRARSTSTSLVVPQTMDLTENSTYTFPSSSSSSGNTHEPPSPTFQHAPSLPPYASSSKLPTPPSFYDLDTPEERKGPTSILTSAYNFGESSIIRLLNWTGRRRHGYDGMAYRRDSDDGSEKGLNGSDNDTVESDGRRSDESVRRPGRYWGMQDPGDETEDSGSGYFALPPTPPDHEIENIIYPEFAHALHPDASGSKLVPASLPTPALSTRSLSRGNSKKNKLRKVFRRNNGADGDAEDQRGWLTAVYGVLAGYRGGKTGEVLKELGWTVGLLVGTFFVTAGLVLWLIQGMPITTLKHIPQSTTDLQLLSAEIRSYMASSDSGWWHTVSVLFLVGCWKHAWSVPGAVVLNILVGSLLDPMPALALLTLITATGSLGAYTLSRPLAPLIAVLFPKPLSLVRAALAPDSIPGPSSSISQSVEGEIITPIQASSDPSARPIGGPTEKSAVWRRLLIMRAMGFVPWSGMNVACGVVGVNWKTFWLTTAAGSASWSYVTASVGHILARLKVPSSALAAASTSVSDDISDDMLHAGESLTSLLRDPVLIFKLVFLSALTLLPVILKRRNNPSSDSGVISNGPTAYPISIDSSEGTSPRSSSSFELSDMNPQTPTDAHDMGRGGHFRPAHPAISTLRLDLDGAGTGSGPSSPPMSPLSTSLAKFTPTPRMFDLFSFGRSAVRQGQRALGAGVRAVRGDGRGGVV
ncbi:hypothetical protein IAU59_003037 [Kwoniella sp. CBS 9459]